MVEIQVHAESRRQPLFPDAGSQHQDRAGAALVPVLRDGPQPVVEGAAAQGRTLAHHPEAAPVVPGDNGVEPAPAVEIHLGTQPVDAWGEGRRQAVDGSHRVHPADEQGEPLPGHRVGPNKVRGSLEAQDSGGFTGALRRQVVSPAGRQVGRAVADAPRDAIGQQAGQPPMNGNVGLAQDHRQFRRVHEGHTAEVMEQFLVGDAHVSSVSDDRPGGQQASVSGNCSDLGC